jgi:hypothetical protein
MQKFVIAALCGFALFACRQESSPSPATNGKTTKVIPSDVRNAKISEVIQPAPQFIDHAMLGSEVGPDGTVKKDSDTFDSGQPVYLTMFFRESPVGLQSSAVLTTIDKHPVKTERRDMNGAKVATFALGDLKPGRYKVVGYWGGNIATEREFEVQAAKSKRKKG